MTLDEIIVAKEGERFEFKEAKHSFSFDKLLQYLCAYSNLGGGHVVFGVSDLRPRQVVGSMAFEQPERVRRTLIDKLKVGVDFELFNEGTDQRVLVFTVAGRPVGLPVMADGIAWWRDGDSLVPMPEDVRFRIYGESGEDFTAKACERATIDDLDDDAIEAFRQVWIAKSGLTRLAGLSKEQLLSDCEALTRGGGVTYAALILFGRHDSLAELLANSETVFEYRQNEASGPAGQRVEFREGFFAYFDRLWELVNMRNVRYSLQEGFFLRDIFAYNERVVREATLNAICHRNYQLPGSVFIRQYPDRIVFESPGGFVAGVTPENIIDRQAARNRRLAEILAKCGLVERAGQGMNLIYEETVKEAKALPDFAGTDAFRVCMTIGALVTDEKIVRFFEAVGEKTLAAFSTEDFLVIRNLLLSKPFPAAYRRCASRLAALGVLERVGRTKYLVARKYYEAIGHSGEFTRLKGLDNATNQALLKKHMLDEGNPGIKLSGFAEVLPALSSRQIQILLKGLESFNEVYVRGKGAGAKWYLRQTQGELNAELNAIERNQSGESAEKSPQTICLCGHRETDKALIERDPEAFEQEIDGSGFYASEK